MSYIRMTREELLPLCESTKKQCDEWAKKVTTKRLEELRAQKNWFRKWFFLRPLTLDEVRELARNSTDVFDLWKYFDEGNECPEYQLAEKMENACKHSKQVCVSIEDLEKLTR